MEAGISQLSGVLCCSTRAYGLFDWFESVVDEYLMSDGYLLCRSEGIIYVCTYD